MSNYKREMPFETRQKISNSLRGVKKSEHTKALIGQKIKQRWSENPPLTSTSNSKNNE